ncbi:hypothetical protein JL720_2108 [Aureococcus anophagefferens]|nr:hypothetical protein JL720_2108 [Aureococcus anophagefferens]
MRDPDFYKVLGLTKRATAADIRKAYKKKALETHPDKNPGRNTEDAFKAVGEAYATLSDEARRKDYDAALAGGGASSRGSSRGGAEGFAPRPAPGFDPSFGERLRRLRLRRRLLRRGAGRAPRDGAPRRRRLHRRRRAGPVRPLLWERVALARRAAAGPARKVTQISTIKRANGSMESMTRTTVSGGESFDYFNRGHVLHGGRGHVVDVDVHEGALPYGDNAPLPYGGDANRAAAARDRNAVREIMQRRAPRARRRRALGGRADDDGDLAQLRGGWRAANDDEDLARSFARRARPVRLDLDEADEAFARRLAGGESDALWR